MTDQNARTILVIEDEKDILATLQEFLELEGYHVEVAKNGLEALDLIHTRGEPPDLILLDMRMPVLNGWQFAAALRDRYGCAPPILVMSAAPDTAARAAEIGATAWVSKPFGLDELAEKIKTYAA